jgi:hypothetical protein
VGLIDHNPIALVTRPAVKWPDVRPPQVAQAERLIDTAMAQDPDRLRSRRRSHPVLREAVDRTRARLAVVADQPMSGTLRRSR